MNTSSLSDTVDDLKDKGRNLVDRVKEAAQDNVIDPAVDAAKKLAEAAREGAGRAADFGRRAAHSTNEWVGSHSYPVAGISFLAGIALGIFIGRKIR